MNTGVNAYMRKLVYEYMSHVLCVYGWVMSHKWMGHVTYSIGSACCIWSVISSISNLNRWWSSLGLFCHVPLKKDQRDGDWRLRWNDAPNATGYTLAAAKAYTWVWSQVYMDESCLMNESIISHITLVAITRESKHTYESYHVYIWISNVAWMSGSCHTLHHQWQRTSRNIHMSHVTRIYGSVMSHE